MKDLRKLYQECLKELDDIGIKYGKISIIKENSRLTRTWGYCKRLPYPSHSWEDNRYEINISSRLLSDDVDDVHVKDTIIHEILHTCKNSLNHGAEWKRLANIVNEHYPQYNIKTRTSSSEKKIDDDIEFKYIIECSSCHHQWKYRKKTKVVKFCEALKCPLCKTETLHLIKE